MQEDSTLEPGMIVQITRGDHHWFPCLAIVSEVKSFGCQGYITIPNKTKEPNNNAYIRLNKDDYEIVGIANIVAGRSND